MFTTFVVNENVPLDYINGCVEDGGGLLQEGRGREKGIITFPS
jgi:hypothetical protein